MNRNELNEFLTLPWLAQLRYVRSLRRPEAKVLWSRLVDLAEDTGDGPAECSVLSRILERADPDEYRESFADPDLRLALSPAALARVKAETRQMEAEGVRPKHDAQLAIDQREVAREMRNVRSEDAR